jgi:glutamate N-acetyltransferase / amino-acid N-acetyltransferase
MPHSISPLAPKTVPQLPPIKGVRIATAQAGIKYKNRTDVLCVTLSPGTQAAGVFTRSKCPSAPVDWCREALKDGEARVLVVNSGNSNAFTGRKGQQAVEHTVRIAAKAAGCMPDQVYIASTGVIGEPLDASKFEGVLEECVAIASPDQWEQAASAIMTTDTFPKLATRTVKLGAQEITINGITKGAGMIAPDMATMLAFIFTDAAISQAVLQEMLAEGADQSFNCVTVDGDTSTSDTLLLFATGTENPMTSRDDPRFAAFREALHDLLIELAQLVAKDGEGARKFVTVNVTGAVSYSSAKTIALSIANSPLVKTAIAGEDANWGRVVMAVGKAGEPAERDLLSIAFGPIRVAFEGARDPDYNEQEASAYMKGENIVITADLGLGEGAARVWTCDLTKAYVEINGDYRS